MSSEIATKDRAGAVMAVSVAEKGERFEGDVSDILIPKVLIGQSTSKLVQDEKVAFGQVWRSTTGEVLGGKGTPFKVIPLSHNKQWVISKKVEGRFKFVRSEPHTVDNADRDWTWSEVDKTTGKLNEMKREKVLNFYVLLPEDIERDLAARKAFEETGDLPDAEASLLPCLIQFKSTSYTVGKTLVTHFAKAADFGVKPFVNTFLVDTEKEVGDTNSWYLFTLVNAGKTSPEYLTTCAKWRDIVAKAKVKVDDSDLEAAAPSDADAPSAEVC